MHVSKLLPLPGNKLTRVHMHICMYNNSRKNTLHNIFVFTQEMLSQQQTYHVFNKSFHVNR